MTERLKYHFEPEKGWQSDPNGLVFFRGRYHAFFQHYPFDTKCLLAYWGHAVSDDLIHWQQLPIAISPDKEYENGMGCYSGSAIVKDDRLYIFYTGSSRELGQVQCMAYSDDGITFTKYMNNPIIATRPSDTGDDFRDPKVTLIGDTYHMVLGGGKNGMGKILHYTSADLHNWVYAGVLYQDSCAPVFECPDFFPYGEGYVLMFSQIFVTQQAMKIMYGSFDSLHFIPSAEASPEYGPHFYAPQTFEDGSGRRILIAWLGNWDRKTDPDVSYAGAFTIPRELSVTDGTIRLYPVKEAQELLTDHDEMVEQWQNIILVNGDNTGDTSVSIPCSDVRSLKILRDTKTIEVFVNAGEQSCTLWFGK